MATASATPISSRASAIAGSFTRLERMTGMLTASLIFSTRSMLSAWSENIGAMTWSFARLAYMPLEALMPSKPTASMWRARTMLSAMVRPPGTRSSVLMRAMIGKSSPQFSRMAARISSTMRTRFSKQPP